MKIMRNKSKVAIAILLMLSFAISMFAVLPNANAAVISKPDRPTGAYLSVNPPLLGVGQPLTVSIQIYPSPNGPNIEMGASFRDQNATGYNGQPLYGAHFEGITVTLTRTDGSKETILPP